MLQNQAKQIARNQRAAILESGIVPTPAEIQLLKDQFNESTNYMYPEVADDTFDTIPTIQTKATEDQRAEMRRLYETFQLTPEAVVATANQEIIDAYLPKANASVKVMDASGYDAKIHEDRIEDLQQFTSASSRC